MEQEKSVKSRPMIEIDWDKVDEMLAIGCIGTEIADALGICSDTLYDRTVKEKGVSTFSAYSSKIRANTFLKDLREAQHGLVKDKNPAMCIWLGKQNLSQKEPEPVLSEQNKSALVEYLETQKKKAADATPRPVEQAITKLPTVDSKD